MTAVTHCSLGSAQRRAANDSAPQPQTLAFTFTGSGKEYFRIWIVNLCLSVATLGIYAAWAKVRRLQYFDRNTHLAGASFDFRGDPKAILRGRVLALLLLAAYHYAFGFSLALGLGVVGALLLALPFLMRSALRFRLHNTHYRGLHFDFGGAAAGAYRAYLPPLVTFLLPGALVALDPTGNKAAFALLLYLGWPLMFGTVKRYQHQNLQFGAEQSAYSLGPWSLFQPYLVAVLLGLGGMFAAGLAVGVLAGLPRGPAGAGPSPAATPSAIALVVFTLYGAYLLVGPYLQVRIANLVWSHTTFRGIAIRCDMSALAFLRLQAANTLLTILSMGLYRPFAAVRIYQYRLAHMALHAQGHFEQIAASTGRGRPDAAGDGAVELLGVDLSW